MEFFRALDRIRLEGRVPESALAAALEVFQDFMGKTDIVPLSELILERASQPLSLPLKTLDAIHLATALEWRSSESGELTLVTHDIALARASRAMGLPVLGVAKA